MNDNIVKTRVSNKMYDEIKNACSELGLTTSEFIRGAINYSLKSRAKKQNNKGGGVSAQEWIDAFYDNYMKEAEKNGYLDK